jgi:hypothetical protein
MFQAILESPIIFDGSLLGSLRPPAASAEFVFDLSLLQQEFNLVGTKFPPSRAQTFRPFPQYYGCQSPILGYDNIPFIRHICDFYVGFLGIVSHHDMVIRLNIVIKAGHRPHRNTIFPTNFHADLQDGFRASIRVHQNLHGITPPIQTIV